MNNGDPIFLGAVEDIRFTPESGHWVSRCQHVEPHAQTEDGD